jgi:AbrB family looped-hinge helix DNA binding protein
MVEVGTVTSKSMVTIPARIREKYGFREGRKVLFIEQDGAVLMIPALSLGEMRGLGAAHADLIIEGIKELDTEHRREARE